MSYSGRSGGDKSSCFEEEFGTVKRLERLLSTSDSAKSSNGSSPGSRPFFYSRRA
jgi:hypothetical protein